jgi:hypothetical protein
MELSRLLYLITSRLRCHSHHSSLCRFPDARNARAPHHSFRATWLSTTGTLVDQWVSGEKLELPKALSSAFQNPTLSEDDLTEMEGLWKSFTECEYTVRVLDAVLCD